RNAIARQPLARFRIDDHRAMHLARMKVRAARDVLDAATLATALRRQLMTDRATFDARDAESVRAAQMRVAFDRAEEIEEQRRGELGAGHPLLSVTIEVARPHANRISLRKTDAPRIAMSVRRAGFPRDRRHFTRELPRARHVGPFELREHISHERSGFPRKESRRRFAFRRAQHARRT